MSQIGTVRPFRRSPVPMLRHVHVGPFQGQGTVWNLSPERGGNSRAICRCELGRRVLDRQLPTKKHLCGYSDRGWVGDRSMAWKPW